MNLRQGRRRHRLSSPSDDENHHAGPTVEAVWKAFGYRGRCCRILDTLHRRRPPMPGRVPAASDSATTLSHPIFNGLTAARPSWCATCAAWPPTAIIALDRSMIPLGSCTMKLNAATRDGAGELARAGQRMHPFAPLDQTVGLPATIIDRTGTHAGWPRSPAYAAVSLQPNSRSAGRAGRPAGHPVLPPQPGATVGSATCA